MKAILSLLLVLILSSCSTAWVPKRSNTIVKYSEQGKILTKVESLETGISVLYGEPHNLSATPDAFASQEVSKKPMAGVAMTGIGALVGWGAGSMATGAALGAAGGLAYGVSRNDNPSSGSFRVVPVFIPPAKGQ